MKLKLLLALLLGLMFTISANAKVHSGVEVKIQSLKNSIGNDEDVFVKLTYKNRSRNSINILRWYLPDSDGNLEEGIFNITHNGESIDYLGAHYKRPAPTQGDYVTLAPNKKLSYTVELSGAYDFSQEGFYNVELSASNFEMFGVSNKGNGKNKSVNTTLKSGYHAEVYVAKVRSNKGKPCNPRKEDCGTEPPGGSDVSFSGACSNSEQSTILSAVDAAKTMTNSSVSYLNGNSGNRYTTWFGTYSSNRWNTVGSNFDAIKDALDNQSKIFDCKCNQNYYAYVYPNEPYKVYLCRAFWTAGLTGTDSKGGTIIHEISHFNVVAGTDDVVYGQSGAQNLADSDPTAAITNADSHEYFAENTPNLN